MGRGQANCGGAIACLAAPLGVGHQVGNPQLAGGDLILMLTLLASHKPPFPQCHHLLDSFGCDAGVAVLPVHLACIAVTSAPRVAGFQNGNHGHILSFLVSHGGLISELYT